MLPILPVVFFYSFKNPLLNFVKIDVYYDGWKSILDGGMGGGFNSLINKLNILLHA